MGKQNQPIMREIKSFVKREGRLTPGQQRGLDELWPIHGHNLDAGMIDVANNTVLEIGFGNGSSLLDMAAAAPETPFIGVEVHRPGVGALLIGIEKRQLSNLTVYKDDAIEVLKQCIPDNSVARVQLYFPDPWPKKKHHKRRILQSDFVELVWQKLQPDGIFHMATDWQHYAEQMLEIMDATPGFENAAGKNEYSPKPDYRPTTKFEVRGQKLGHDVWDLLYKRN